MIGVVVGLVCRRTLIGRFVVETDDGDRFEFLVIVRGNRKRLRRLGPPRWREGAWPHDAPAIAAAARQSALDHAALHEVLACPR